MYIKIARMPHRQHGLTLVELVIFLVVVSIAVAGVLGVLSYTARNSADPQITKQALAIGEGLLEEVQLARFTYCDPTDANAETASSAAGCATVPERAGQEAGGPTRPFDNISDYVTTISTTVINAPQSFTAGDTTGRITDAAGNNVYVADGKNNLATYTAFVRIYGDETLGAIAALNQANKADTNVFRISVTVNYAVNRSVVVEGYRTRYAPNALP